MIRDEAPGFFRGSEFSKLLILAALVVIGWALILYYGLQGHAPEPEKAPPVATIPPLPPPDKTAEFARLNDKTIRSSLDGPALRVLLERTRTVPESSLASIARRDVLPVDMNKRPARYRGLPIHLEGFASKVFALDDEDTDLVPGGRLYEVWMRPAEHDQGIYPCCLLLEQVPPTLPAGRELDEPVSFDGYFLKLLAYRAGDTNRFAPMLVGRLRHNANASGPFKVKRSWVWTYVPVGLLMVYVTGRLFFRLRKSLPSMSRRPSSVPIQDQIDPHELGQWLADPSSDDS